MDKGNLNFQLYRLDDNNEVEVLLNDETIWLTQKSMSELFDVGVPAIAKHLNNIFLSGELEEEPTVSKMEIVQTEGKRTVSRKVTFYNLDAIISVGYRVNSLKATRFRQWATRQLKELMIKGFVLDDERLKQGNAAFGKDYFKELLERVRSIRASERRIWLQITDLFAEISIDYDKNSQTTKNFYAMVQNKFHYAITGNTAAEIIYQHSDSDHESMGLTTWKNSPAGRILKSDTAVAKNYLTQKQIRRLERTVSGYFDYIEDLIEDEQVLTMEDFAKSIDRFLVFRNYKVLADKESISMKEARTKAYHEYDKYNKDQAIHSDFEKQIQQLSVSKKKRTED